jgi:hypothetical protein
LTEYRLTVSDHIDAPRLARVFIRGIIGDMPVSDDAKTAVVLMVSDAATDSVRSGHSITISAEQTEDTCRLIVEGAHLAPPMVISMPHGLTVDAGAEVLTITIGTE